MDTTIVPGSVFASPMGGQAGNAIVLPCSDLGKRPVAGLSAVSENDAGGGEESSFEAASHLLVHELVERQIARSPDGVALRFEGKDLTYRELGARADRLADQLIELGAGPSRLIAVYMERSLEMVVTLLAIMKAGGAYVPVDPEYPAERTAFMIQDAGVAVVLTQAHLEKTVPASNARIVCVDGPSQPGALGERLAARRASPEDLAYMIYTSGSTGRPKGAMNAHRGAVNRLLWTQSEFKLSPADVVLQKTPFSFDISVWEFFWPLMTGARMVIARPGGHRQPDYLARLIQEEGVTIVHFVPSMLDLFLSEPLARGCRSLRDVICSGEALPHRLQDRFFDTLAARLTNLYGPTEAAVDVTCWHCRRGDGPAIVPIGYPIANTVCYVVDENLRLAAPGCEGELLIGGVQVGVGYWNRPELTAAKFLPDPFSSDPCARVYRSGDLVRQRPDGCIDYLGRIDTQIKIRGHRIELGEIEAALSAIPGILQAAATAIHTADGQNELIACVTGPGSGTLSAEEVRRRLAAKLPEYMVPARILAVGELPLTPNGKLDRKALPPADAQDLVRERPFSPPRNDIEIELVRLWEAILRRHPIGIQDSFFDHGGHSLLALKVIAMVRSRYNVALSLGDFLRRPVIADMAATIAVSAGSPEAGLIPRASREVLQPVSVEQAGLWFIQQAKPSSSSYNVGGAWRLRGPLDCERLRLAWRRVVERHELLRSRIIAPDGRPLLEIVESSGQEFAIKGSLDVGILSADQIKAEIERDLNRPFDLSKAPLWRAQCLRCAAAEHILVLTLHHVVSDEWSLRILFTELETFYSGRGETPAKLPELSIQYQDYAASQQQWLAGLEASRAREFWRRQLAGLKSPRRLPCVDSHREHSAPRTGKLAFSLPACTRAGLEKLAREEDASAFMGALAGFLTFLAHWSNQTEVTVATPFSLRDRPGLEHLIGYFINLLPIRVKFDGSQDFRKALRLVKQAVLDSFAFGTLPLAEISRLAPSLPCGQPQALFNTMFVLLNEPWPAPQLAGITAEPFPTLAADPKCDCIFFLTDDGQEGWLAELEYNAALISSDSVASMASEMQKWFACLAEDTNNAPSLIGKEISLLNSIISETPCGPGARFDAGLPSVVECFEGQVERTPDSFAVIDSGRELTYRSLNAEANRWARHLLSLGAARGSIIGLHLARSEEFIVAALAVLKIGAAYLPLALDDPCDRLAFLAKDAGIRFVLAHGKTATFPESVQVVAMADEAGRVRSYSSGNLELALDSGDAAYVMFTSGSTGRPKGVVVPHRAIIRLVCETDFLPWSSDLRFLLLAPVAFDASTLELWGPLLHGGTCVVHPEKHATFAGLESAIRQHGISCLWLTAGLFNQIIDDRPELLEPVKFLMTGGEALSVAHVRRALEALPKTTLINGYGPTEGTTFTTTYTIPRGESAQFGSSIPIGMPLAGTTCYVVDSEGRPAGPGETGELWIGGAGLAIGYLNRPELTAEKFITDPFGSEPAGRLYRSGDLCRRLPDGNLDFVGRLDQQVKIRGFRIELGEIAEILRERSEVLDAVAVVQEPSPNLRHLVAYVSTAIPMANGWEEEVRESLKVRLPIYSVPVAVIRLPQLPLTANGKLDRQALPPWRPESREQVNPPEWANETEAVSAAIFGSVLGQNPNSQFQNFFELGGHSLLAMRVIAEAKRRAGVELSVGTFLANPTVLGLTEAIERARQAPPRPVAVDDSRPVVVWFGGAPWPPEAWPPDLELCEIHLPDECTKLNQGRMTAEAAGCARLIRERKLGPSTVFAAYCYSGLVAAETATQCAESGNGPLGLVLVDCIPTPVPIKWSVSVGRRLAEWRRLDSERAKLSVAPWYETADRLHHWASLGFGGLYGRWQARRKEHKEASARAVQSAPSPRVSGLGEQVFQLSLAGCYWAVAEHRVRPFPGPITLLLADELRRRRNVVTGAPWRGLAHSLVIDTTPGSHVSCLRQHAGELAQQIAKHARRQIEASRKR